MKTIIKTAIIGLFCAFATGCAHRTGFTFVDYDTAEANGIQVTKFTDNSFVATIEYDYSNIEDFDPKNLEVTLVKTIVPLEQWWDPNRDLTGYNDRQLELQKKLMNLVTAEEKPLYWYSDRPATVLKNVPGKVKVLSFDDMGAYKLEYGKKQTP